MFTKTKGEIMESSDKGIIRSATKTIEEQQNLITACQTVMLRQQMEIQALRDLLDGINSAENEWTPDKIIKREA